MPVVFAGLLFLSSGFYSVGHAQSFQVAQIAQLRNWEQRRADGSSAGGTSEDEVLNDAEVLAAQANQLSKIEVTAVARVKKLLPDDTRGLQHQKFLLILSNGSTVLVANDLSYGQRVPVQPGSVVRIHGEYVWNKLGGLIHWTHRSDTPRHEGGWIEFAGTRYQ
jgi:hypothetical protein